MVEEIFPVEELPSAKRRKRWDELHAYFEMPVAQSWQGAVISPIAEARLLKIIEETNQKVSKTSLDNMRLTREDHDRESKLLHTRRFHKRVQHKNLLNRTLDKIHRS